MLPTRKGLPSSIFPISAACETPMITLQLQFGSPPEPIASYPSADQGAHAPDRYWMVSVSPGWTNTSVFSQGWFEGTRISWVVETRGIDSVRTNMFGRIRGSH